MPRKYAVPIVNQVPVGVVETNDLSQLLLGPARTRVRRHICTYKTAAAVLYDDNNVEHSERYSDRHKEVTCQNRLRMVLQER